MVERTATRRKAVNAEEKMHQRAGVKLHHGWMANAPTGGLLLRDKQDEVCCLTGESSQRRRAFA
jgi:hypothetical protein